MRNAQYLTPAGDVLSYEAEDGRTVVCDQGTPEFSAVLELVTPAPYVAPPPDVGAYRVAIDAHVEAVAQSRGYNGAAHLASYAVSTVPAWAAEARAFVAWRDAVWLEALGELAKVTGGAEVPPAVNDLIAGLPVIQWPEG